jgi:hypothetical protein
MIKLVVKEKKIIEDGVYEAKLIGIDEASGKYGPYLKFKFTIIEDCEFKGMNAIGFVKKDLQVGNKLYKWLSALNGGSFDVNETVIVEDQIGKKCKLIITNNTDDEGNVNYKVDSIVPRKKKHIEEDDEVEEKPKKKHAVEDDEVEDEEVEDEEKPKKKDVEFEDDDEEEKPKKKDVEFEDDEEDDDDF